MCVRSSIKGNRKRRDLGILSSMSKVHTKGEKEMKEDLERFKEFQQYITQNYRKQLIDMMWDLDEKFPEKRAISITTDKGDVTIRLKRRKR